MSHRLLRVRRHNRAEHATRAEQRVALVKQRQDRKVDALEARGRPLEVAMINGQHHGAPGLRIEGPRQAVLHAPVELVRAFEEKARGGLWRSGLVAFAFLVGFGHFPSSSNQSRAATATVASAFTRVFDALCRD
jgi:hypothetical protein